MASLLTLVALPAVPKAAEHRLTPDTVNQNGVTEAFSLKCMGCCHGKIDWSNWGKCKCDKGWTGKSCDTLETCTKGMKPLCPMSRLKTLNVKCEQFPVAITIGTAAMGLPTSLQGVFTSINPEASHVPDKLPSDVDEQGGADGNSFIMSFAQSADGDGIGQVYPNGDDAGYQLTIRTHGDRTWSDAVPIPKQPDITKVLDLVYRFKFLTKDKKKSADPDQWAFANISPTMYTIAKGLTVPKRVMNFMMALEKKGENDQFPTSVVWNRPSTFLGMYAKSQFYQIVQVIDGEGNKLEPAYSTWVNNCKKYSNINEQYQVNAFVG